MDSLLHDDLKFYLSKSSARIEYTVKADSGREYFVRIDNGKLSTSKSISNEDLLFTKESWVSETRNIIPTWKANPANSKGWLGFFFHETMNDFDEAANVVKNVSMDFIGAKITVTNISGINRFLLSLPTKHDPIELRFTSSGMQTAAPLAMLVEYFANSFSFKEAKRRSVLSYLYDADQLADFHPQIELSDIATIINMHIEEPELSLDPASQIHLIEHIVAKAFHNTANPMTIMLATHSPYIVNALNLIISRKEGNNRLPFDSVSVYRLVNGTLIDLSATDEEGRHIVDTSDLTAPMEGIYDEYQSIYK